MLRCCDPRSDLCTASVAIYAWRTHLIVWVAKTRAIAFANAVNLRGGDVPGRDRVVLGFETSVSPPFGSCVTHVGANSDEFRVSIVHQLILGPRAQDPELAR